MSRELILIRWLLHWPVYKAFYKEAIDSHENLKKIIFQPYVSDLDKKKCSKYCYCYTGLDAITTSFVEHFKENQENITCVYLAVIILWQQEYYIVKQMLHGIMNSYFYVDSTATMLTARKWRHSIMNNVTKSPHFKFKKSFGFPFLLKWHHKMVRLSKIMPVLLGIK